MHVDRSRFRVASPDSRAQFADRSANAGYVRRPVAVSRVIDINAPLPTPTMPQQVQQPQPVSPVLQPTPQPIVQHAPRITAQPQTTFTQTATQLVEQPTESKRQKTKRNKSTVVLYAMATILLIAGIAVSVNGFIVNRHVSATVAHLSAASNGANDDKEPPPSTVKPTDTDVKNYTVAANMARYISIPKIDVFARVLSMGVTNKNQLRAPGNVYDAGWYNGSSLPGLPGASLIDGHVSSWSTHGVFYGLNKLAAGDEIQITKGDGQVLTYQVVKAEIKPSDKVDMASLLVSQDTAKPGLNLISCAGDVVPGTNEFDKRIIVYATLKL